jgi:protein-L-isoaspartate(D-aspartate) O-methyltransferase
VPREAFVPREFREYAYEDSPLPIGGDQTVSQPYIVAFMIEALELQGGEKVLEIGAGSGYAVAVLAEMPVRSMRLSVSASWRRINLQVAGYQNLHIKHADGTGGWADQAPFDAILVSASSPAVPAALKQQLEIGGRMVILVGSTVFA